MGPAFSPRTIIGQVSFQQRRMKPIAVVFGNVAFAPHDVRAQLTTQSSWVKAL
jgi:hypothetical protein